jgi:hypothetical protein
MVRKAHKPLLHRGLYPIEVEYLFSGKRYTAKAYVPLEFYVECQVGSRLVVRVLPSSPCLCVPVFTEQAPAPGQGAWHSDNA